MRILNHLIFICFTPQGMLGDSLSFLFKTHTCWWDCLGYRLISIIHNCKNIFPWTRSFRMEFWIIIFGIRKWHSYLGQNMGLRPVKFTPFHYLIMSGCDHKNKMCWQQIFMDPTEESDINQVHGGGKNNKAELFKASLLHQILQLKPLIFRVS